MHIEIYSETYLGTERWFWYLSRVMHKQSENTPKAGVFATQEQAVIAAKSCLTGIFKEIDVQVKFETINVDANRKIIRWRKKEI